MEIPHRTHEFDHNWRKLRRSEQKSQEKARKAHSEFNDYVARLLVLLSGEGIQKSLKEALRPRELNLLNMLRCEIKESRTRYVEARAMVMACIEKREALEKELAPVPQTED